MKHYSTLLGVAILAFAACKSPGPSKRTHPIAWRAEYIENRILELQHDNYVGWYYFHTGGSVSATIGEKNDRIAAPLWQWRIDDSGRLYVFDDDGADMLILDLLKMDSDRITARNENGYLGYYLLKNPE